MAVRLGAQLSMNDEIIVDNFAGGEERPRGSSWPAGVR